MIDTDKYEGHTEGSWELVETSENGTGYEDIKSPTGYTIAQMCDSTGADSQLIADAPLLLQEVKRLREEITALNKWADNVREFFGDEAMIDLYDIYGGEEE